MIGKTVLTHLRCHSGCKPKSTSSKINNIFDSKLFNEHSKTLPKRLRKEYSPELKACHLKKTDF